MEKLIADWSQEDTITDQEMQIYADELWITLEKFE